MSDYLPIQPSPETCAGIEPTLRTSQAGPGTPGPTAFTLRLPAPPQRSDPPDAEVLTHMISTVDALAAAGRLRGAIELARTTLSAGLATVPAARLRCTLSSLLCRSGRPAEAATEAERLLADPDLPEDVHNAAEVVVLEAVTAFEDVMRTWDRAADAEAIVTSRERYSDEVVVVALNNLAHTAWGQGRIIDALDLIQQAVCLASAGTSQSARPHPRLWLVGMLTSLRRFSEARAQLRILRGDNPRLGHTAYAAVFAANFHLAAGRVHDAAVEVDAGLAAADASETELFTPWALSILATTALRRGDLAAATRHTLGAARQRAATGPSYGHERSTWVAAQVAAAMVGPHESLRVLADLLAAPHVLRRLLLTEPAAAAWLVRTSLACADRMQAEAVVAQADSLATENPNLPTLAAAAAHANGLLHGDRDALQRASHTHQDPWARASAAEDLAVLLAHQDLYDQAITWCCHAIKGYEHSESARDASRVRGRLGEIGLHNQHWTNKDASVVGWATCADTEPSAHADKAATETLLRAHAASRAVRLGDGSDSRIVADTVNG